MTTNTVQSSNPREFRRTAILLEAIPFAVANVGIAVDHFLMSVVPFIILGLIYLVGAWYLFRGSRPNRWWMIVLGHLGAVVYALLLFGSLLKLLDLPNAMALLRLCAYLGFPLAVAAVITYFRQRPLDRWAYRFGLKLCSRVLLFAFMAWYIVLNNA